MVSDRRVRQGSRMVRGRRGEARPRRPGSLKGPGGPRRRSDRKSEGSVRPQAPVIWLGFGEGIWQQRRLAEQTCWIKWVKSNDVEEWEGILERSRREGNSR